LTLKWDGVTTKPAKMLRSSLFTFAVLAVIAFGVGLLINLFRENPLPLVYQSKAKRLKDSLSTVGAFRNPHAAISDFPTI
jgi:hypothetical protein